MEGYSFFCQSVSKIKETWNLNPGVHFQQVTRLSLAALSMLHGHYIATEKSDI
jgi:hypothetical protein